MNMIIKLPNGKLLRVLYSCFVNVMVFLIEAMLLISMEHLNAVGKGFIKALGTNKTMEAIQCLTKALGTIIPVLKKLDKENNVSDISRHTK